MLRKEVVKFGTKRNRKIYALQIVSRRNFVYRLSPFTHRHNSKCKIGYRKNKNKQSPIQEVTLNYCNEAFLSFNTSEGRTYKSCYNC